MSSSTTTVLSRQPLVQVLRSITDPRNRRGVRHDLPTVLSLAVTGVLAGCRSLTAIWEHATDQDRRKASESAEVAKLKAEVCELRGENEFLKKAAAWLAKERP